MSSELIFVQYKGYIAIATEATLGLSTRKHGSVEIWLPRSQVGNITYANRETGDSRMVFVNVAIEAVEIPVWLAREKGLTTNE